MQFPSEPTFADRLVLLTRSFRYRCGPMMLLAALFMAKDSPRFQAFGIAMLGWVLLEGVLKLCIDARKD
ncbi:hypothetical protein SRABI118_00696 [Massilia sp. Bi118]|uniref:hypothetical protein n=1 Tax=Massilia sp. Bi118 TaxID=2822346 RepID=UPI001D57DE7A|nr:hypothetical protein [Massilia sp. Bi118]CAH0158394.1 hypothetical protein SRABI118_00696 [Massilia sp. Bi118]